MHLVSPTPGIRPQLELALADEECQSFNRECAGTFNEIISYNYSC